ncbi:MAG: hypothetical protein CMG00_03605 [Candidatus Marinimicrobia bacterium]|nr:hypothetical protein [Candidatus Neomarinimicrobiota bacterium]|tara:strand:+ start:2534 stop:3343 length:810 start_codon:yes stop_codon:yes gene_type:complete
MRRVKKEDYSSWQSYYWNYQKILAEDYYIPYLLDNSNILKSKANYLSVIDIGCGNGGFADALNALDGNFSKIRIKGIEIKDFSSWNNSKTTYSVHNIIKDDNKNYKQKYDIVILRDVIEHIHKKDTEFFMKEVASFLRPEGEVLITFPPYFSPFGLHQQTIMKSFLRYIPFLSLLPKSVLKKVVNQFESENVWDKIEEIIDSGMTISNFKKILKKTGLSIYKKRFFSVRPSHEIRYGIKTLRSPFGYFPVFRELLILGTCYILKIKKTS